MTDNEGVKVNFVERCVIGQVKRPILCAGTSYGKVGR